MASLENTKRLHAHFRALLAAGRDDAFDVGQWFTAGTVGVHSVRTLELVQGVTVEEMRDPRLVPCNTTCCLAGWAQVIGAETDGERAVPADEFATWWLDLDDDEASDLFHGAFPHPSGIGEPDLADTVAELGRMIAAMEEEDAACAA